MTGWRSGEIGMIDGNEAMTGASLTKVPVILGGRSYDIVIGSGLLNDPAPYLRDILTRPRLVVVTDETVAALYLQPLRQALDASGIETHALLLPPGEATKSFSQLESLCSQLLDLEVERRDTIMALGGGVIGDLVGFSAAILRRGVHVIQVPTTLLSQVDSSVGGKTGINMAQGKNLVGAFHQPRLVLIDLDTLQSLDMRQRRAGYAEVVKYGLIDQPDFFNWLEKNGHAVLQGDRTAQNHAVATSCRAKAAVVAADEKESGARALLNLGHSFGHALEAAAGYDGRLLHGEAVAIGMVMAFELSTRLGLAPADEAERVRRHLDALGLPTDARTLELGLDGDAMLALIAQDKKVESGHLVFILLRGIGQAFISRDAPLPEVKAYLDDYFVGR